MKVLSRQISGSTKDSKGCDLNIELEDPVGLKLQQFNTVTSVCFDFQQYDYAFSPFRWTS